MHCAARLHVAKYLHEGHVAHGFVGPSAMEDIFRACRAKLRRSLKDPTSSLGERNNMRLACLPSAGWYFPKPSLQIDFVPRCAPDLAAPGRGEYCRFERQPPPRFLLAHPSKEGGNVGKRHRGMMASAAGLARQALADRPHRRLGLAEALRIGPVDHHPDPLPPPPRRLRLFEPDRGQDIVDLRRRNLADADRSEERRVGKECRSRWSPY